MIKYYVTHDALLFATSSGEPINHKTGLYYLSTMTTSMFDCFELTREQYDILDQILRNLSREQYERYHRLVAK